ncbi:MAG: hypothetical protein JXK07_03840 [Spirochaetes bacterium]|nr:hypothetical protein [Spirochaetota bacterium]MBN2770326.1 hypothetical protein [Spirochaetota bacterium]
MTFPLEFGDGGHSDRIFSGKGDGDVSDGIISGKGDGGHSDGIFSGKRGRWCFLDNISVPK